MNRFRSHRVRNCGHLLAPSQLPRSLSRRPLGWAVWKGPTMYPFRSLTGFLVIIVVAFGGTPSASARPMTAPLELVVLGSGGPGATGRAASCYLVFIDGEARILVDAGPGAFARLG